MNLFWDWRIWKRFNGRRGSLSLQNIASRRILLTVATIAQTLADIEEQAGNTIDWQILYEKALNHDYTERFIGDIKTPVKYANKELRQMLSTVEEKMTDTFIEEEIPESFQPIYRRRLADGKDDSLEGQLLAIADN